MLLADSNDSKILETIKRHLYEMEDPDLDNFKNDIAGLITQAKITNSTKNKNIDHYLLSFTKEPEDFFLCGTEVPGSCQSVTASASTNKCLLGYILNAYNRLVVIKNDAGVIVARSVIRLLWDEKILKPVLLQERIYSNNHDRFKKLINYKVKEMAEKLSIAYVSENDVYPNPLHSLGGQAPFEYSDKYGGSAPDGSYKVKIDK